MLQGSEEWALLSMNFEIPIHVIVVELDGENPEKDVRCMDILSANGFVRVDKTKGLFTHEQNQIWENPHYYELLEQRSEFSKRLDAM